MAKEESCGETDITVGQSHTKSFPPALLVVLFESSSLTICPSLPSLTHRVSLPLSLSSPSREAGSSDPV